MTPAPASCVVRCGRTAPACARWLSVLALTIGLVACGGLNATPTPAPAPTATLAPPVGPTPEPAAQSSDVENAFLSNVDDLIAAAADLTVTPCADLTAETQSNPGLLPSIRGFAAALKRVGSTRAELDTPAVHASLADLDHSLNDMEGALTRCGIKIG